MTDRIFIEELLQSLSNNSGYDNGGGYFYSKIGNLIARTLNNQVNIDDFQKEAKELSNTIEENRDSELLTSYISEIQNNPIDSYHAISEALTNSNIALIARDYLTEELRLHDAYSDKLLLMNEECAQGYHPTLFRAAYSFDWNICVLDDIQSSVIGDTVDL